MGSRDEQAAHMAHLRLLLRVRPDHEAGRVHQAHQGQAMRVAQLHETGRLVGRVSINCATQVQWIVGQQTHRPALDARQRGVNAFAKAGAQFQQGAQVHNASHCGARVVHAQAVFWHHVAQGQCIGCNPVFDPPLKERQIVPRRCHCFKLVRHQNVDDAVAVLYLAGANLLGLEHAQAAALHHGRAAHTDVAFVGSDDHVATAQQRGVAGKAAPRHDAQYRHLAVQAREAGEGSHMQARHDGRVHIARPATAALGKQHHRQLLLQGQPQHAVGLLVVAHALRAGQYCGVIGHHHRAAVLRAKQALVNAADAGHHAVGGGVPDQVIFRAAAALGGHRERAVFLKRVGVAQIGDVFARRAQAQRVAFGHGLGAAGVQRVRVAVQHALQVGTRGAVRPGRCGVAGR